MHEESVEFATLTDDPALKDMLSGGGEALPLFRVFMHPSVQASLNKTLMSGFIGQGPKVDEFEKALSPWFGTERVLAVNSGTSALHLALRLANVGYGDEVISTAMTCTATNEPILERGAKIVWADIDPTTGNIDPDDVVRKITDRTKAVMVVHWGGYPCDLKELRAITSKHGIKLIEDAAHAFGATYQGEEIGSRSDYVCFSFQAIKHLTTVDGGALTCASDEDYRRGKRLRWFGIDRESKRKDFRCEEDVVEHGYKFHMNDVTATIGLSQLRYVRSVVRRHQENGLYYRKRFEGLSGAELLRYQVDRESAFWLFTFLVDRREEFMHAMADAKIVVSQVHSRNDTHTMMKAFRAPLPGVDRFVERMVSIPVGWWISDEQRERIADTVVRLRR